MKAPSHPCAWRERQGFQRAERLQLRRWQSFSSHTLTAGIEWGAFQSLLFFLAEETEAQTKLNGIDAGIGRCKSRVRNMHKADFRAEVALATEEVQTESGAGREIDVGCSFGHLCAGKERAAAKFEIRNHAAVRVQRPFEGERVYAHTVGCVRFLSDQEDRDGVHRILQAAAQKTGTMRRGEDQAVTESHIPDAIVRLAAIEPVAPTGPHL